MNRDLLLILLLLAATAPPAVGQVNAADSPPPIGTRIRVLAPRLGGTWRAGMLNQLRLPTLCYRIVIFDERRPDRIEAMLTIDDLRALQVREHAGRPMLWRPEQEANAAGDGWSEIPLEVLRRAQSCPEGSS